MMMNNKHGGQQAFEMKPPNNDGEQKQEKQAVQLLNNKWNAFLIFCTATVILGSGFAFGYNLAVVNGPFLILNKWLKESFQQAGQSLTDAELNTQWSLAVSLYLIGGVVGSTWFPGILSASHGKRNTLILGATVGIAGEVLIFTSYYTGSYVPFMVGRAVAGFHGGLSMTLAPGLLNEHAPASLRGVCGAFFTIGLSIGIVLADILALEAVLGSLNLWHWLFLIMAGILFLHIMCLIFVVESPRWLVDQKREGEALISLAKLRGVSVKAASSEFEEIKEIARLESTVKPISVMDVFRDRRYTWGMIIAINLHITNQVTGLAAVLIYTVMVLNGAGLDSNTAALANLGIQFAPIIGNIFCSFTVDRFGRRPLMIFGTLGLALFNAFITIFLAVDVYQAAIAGFALFFLTFGAGPGPIPWFMPAEMFNQSSRPMALAVGTFTNWAGNVVVSFAFPTMQKSMGYYSFLPFATIALLESLFFFFFLPETSPMFAGYDIEMFASGKSLIQLGKNKKKQTKGPQ